MCGFRQAGRQWLQSVCFGISSNPGELPNNPQHGQPARGLSENPSRGHPWQPWQEVTGSSGTMTEVESTEVVSKSGNGHCQVQQSCRC